MENKLVIYLVRHGETEWNKEGKLQGWLDSDLTPQGKHRIQQLKEQLRTIRFDAAYSSTSKRAYDTAKILVGEYLTIKRDDRLQEIHLGNWQGKYIIDIQKKDANRYNQYCNDPEKYQPDSGESFQQVMERMNDFFKWCMALHQSGNILIVSHGVAIRALILQLMNLPIHKLWDFEIDGGSVTKITVLKEKVELHYIGKTVIE